VNILGQRRFLAEILITLLIEGDYYGFFKGRKVSYTQFQKFRKPRI